MKKILPFALTICLLLLNCGGLNTKMTGSWKNEDKLKNSSYNSVFIAVMGPSVEAKNMLENELAYRVNNRGAKAFKSHDIFVSTFSKDNLPEKSEMLKIIRDTGAETIFTVALKDKETTTRYVPGTSTYYAPMGYGYYGNFYGYYSNFYPMAYEPGYYKEDKIFYVESNLYDTETEELIWSAQSKTYNPDSSEDFVKDYTQALIDRLIQDGVIKPTK